MESHLRELRQRTSRSRASRTISAFVVFPDRFFIHIPVALDVLISPVSGFISSLSIFLFSVRSFDFVAAVYPSVVGCPRFASVRLDRCDPLID
jgi:hypothetical protein